MLDGYWIPGGTRWRRLAETERLGWAAWWCWSRCALARAFRGRSPGRVPARLPQRKRLHMQMRRRMRIVRPGNGSCAARPGLALAVAVDGKIVYSEGFGYADLEERVPVWPTTKFRIGSISKPLTATALMQLVEAGKLDLDAPVQKYVPSFPGQRRADHRAHGGGTPGRDSPLQRRRDDDPTPLRQRARRTENLRK